MDFPGAQSRPHRRRVVTNTPVTGKRQDHSHAGSVEKRDAAEVNVAICDTISSIMRPLRVVTLFLFVGFAFLLWPQSQGSAAAQTNQSPTTSVAPEKPSGTHEPQSPSSGAPDSSPGDSTRLEVVKSQKAEYPAEAAEKAIQGQVWVKFLISETGDIENVEAISGDPILAKAAIEAAKKWKFKPFIKNGQPVKVSTKLPFDFAFSGKISDTDTSQSKQAQPLNLPQGVSQGLLIHKVQPIYPEAARRNYVQGTVLLNATIGKDGRVRELTPISGPKELVGAAIGAVQQWRYKPYTLNDEPVDVQTQITVNFQLR
jgi:TonB family protein